MNPLNAEVMCIGQPQKPIPFETRCLCLPDLNDGV